MKRILSLLLCIAFFCAVFVPVSETKAIDVPAGGYTSATKIKVGLYYGSNALTSANLQNVTGYGSGYRVGFYDANRSFNPLGYFYNVEITMRPDSTYHVQLPNAFYTFEEANMFAQSVGGYVAYTGNAYYVRCGSYTDYYEASSAASSFGGTVTELNSDGISVYDTITSALLFSLDSTGTNLGIEPIQNSFDPTRTWFKTRQYEGGFEYVRKAEGLTVINIIDIESYIKGVVPYEMNKSWPIEALKAQALSARTYTLVNIGSHKSSGFDVCNTVDCQVYRGCESRNETTDLAVDSTRGMIITYNGEPIQAVYHASNGGATENCENVWHDALPYLRAVADDFESTTNMTYKSWEYEVTNSELTEILRARGNNIAKIVHAYATYTDAGNVKELVFVDANGKKLTYDGEMTRIVLRSDEYNISTNSQRFIFEDKNNPRVTSVSEFQKPASTLQPTSPNAPVLSSPQRTFVLSSFFNLSFLSQKYTAGIPVISKDGVTSTSSVYAMGAGGTPSASGGGILASSLTPPSSSSGTYIIRGSGNGHNLGMSQYGAKAMAEQNYTAEQIVSYYYTGVSIVNYYN